MTIPAGANIEEFYRGAWVAEVTETVPPDGTFEIGGITWQGTVLAPGVVRDGGRYRARVVGGKGKLSTRLPARNYPASITYGTLARDIISESGELPGIVETGGRAPYYERSNGTAGQALGELCDTGAMTWWVGRDGLVNVATERPTDGAVSADKAPQLLASTDGSITLDVGNVVDVQLGMTLSTGSVIRHIRWVFDNKLNAECSPTQPFPETSATFYLKTYGAKVDKQNGNGSVNVIVDGKYTLDNVQLFSALPGTSIKVDPGEAVTVAFFGGVPTVPFAIGFSQDALAGAALALVGDAIEIVLPPFTFVGLENATVPVTGVMTCVLPKTIGKIIGPGSLRTKSR